MYCTANKKMLNMLILDILKEYSDEDNRLTQQRIMRILHDQYGMECDRRSVKRNIEALNELGYEIPYEKGKGYCLISREFDDAELGMLIDSVLFSKTLSKSQTKSLIEKLKALGNKHFSAKVSYISNLQELQHADNKQLMISLDKINDAIADGNKISFVYNEYGTDLKLHPKRDGLEYIVNPYQIVANNGFFYLIGNYDKYDNIGHYRIDKMAKVEIRKEDKVKPKKEVTEFRQGYSLPKHMAEHIYMFSGLSVRVKFLINKDMVGTLVDWFGRDFRILEKGEEMITVSVSCNRSAMRYWALQYGACVEVLEPVSLREEIRDCICEMKEKYCRESL